MGAPAFAQLDATSQSAEYQLLLQEEQPQSSLHEFYEAGRLTPVEKMMVAVYERALKDWMEGVVSSGPEKLENGYTAICWLLDDSPSYDYCSFSYVCEVLGWQPYKIRDISATVFRVSFLEKTRRKLLSTVNCLKKSRHKKWERVYNLVVWVMSDSRESHSFTRICYILGLNPSEIRRELSSVLKGEREGIHLSTLRSKRYNTIY